MSIIVNPQFSFSFMVWDFKWHCLTLYWWRNKLKSWKIWKGLKLIVINFKKYQLIFSIPLLKDQKDWFVVLYNIKNIPEKVNCEKWWSWSFEHHIRIWHAYHIFHIRIYYIDFTHKHQMEECDRHIRSQCDVQRNRINE